MTMSFSTFGAHDRALATLDALIAVDMYLNDTTRHADVILPPPSALQRSHRDLAMHLFAVRNVANYGPAVLPLDQDQLAEWEMFCRRSQHSGRHPPRHVLKPLPVGS